MMMPVHIIGVMSGSSLDGLDMALCRFDEDKAGLIWSLQDAQTVPFPENLYLALQTASSLNGFDLMKLDATFGKWIGVELKQWMVHHSLQASYIASHGHTVFHEPALGFTTQIGSGAHIAFETGLDTITTFRTADIAAGGQGAPFAPVADRIFFPGYEGYLNLGGIANVNLLAENGGWKAWDIGPCNQALNFLARKTGRSFDENGKLAASGTILTEVVDKLLAYYPFRDGLPKGLSNHEVQSSWIQYLGSLTENVIHLLASVTEAIARMVIHHVSPFIKKPLKILVTGGGAQNKFLIDRITTLAKKYDVSIHLPSSRIIDYKECLLMAYLGYLTAQNQPYGIKDMTGASKNTIGGTIFRATR